MHRPSWVYAETNSMPHHREVVCQFNEFLVDMHFYFWGDSKDWEKGTVPRGSVTDFTTLV